MTLGDLVTLQGGGTPARHIPEFWDGEIPWASVKDLNVSRLASTQESISPAGVAASATNVIKAGHVVVATRMAVGRAALLEVDAAINQDLKALIPRAGKRVHPNYLLHLLGVSTPFLEKRATGATVKGIRGEVLESVPVPHPDYTDQCRIADILDKADAICRMRRQTIALTADLLRSAFLDMFGDPVTNPKGWPVKPLGELLANDPRIGTLVPASDKPGTLVVRVGELGAYDVDLSRSKRASLSDGDFERFGIETGDVLLARAIGSAAHLGKASVLQPYHEPVAFDSHVMRLRFRDEVLDPYVFVQWLRTPGGRARFMSEAGRTAVQFNINGKQIVKIQIPLPPRSEQRLFRRLFDSVRTMEQRSRAALRESESIFDSLVARAFTGALVGTR
jgi:type I restriction enzyme S subunit